MSKESKPFKSSNNFPISLPVTVLSPAHPISNSQCLHCISLILQTSLPYSTVTKDIAFFGYVLTINFFVQDNDILHEQKSRTMSSRRKSLSNKDSGQYLDVELSHTRRSVIFQAMPRTYQRICRPALLLMLIHITYTAQTHTIR